jgi:hypothetical protein
VSSQLSDRYSDLSAFAFDAPVQTGSIFTSSIASACSSIFASAFASALLSTFCGSTLFFDWQHVTEILAALILRSPPESALGWPDNRAMFAGEEPCHGVTEYLEALLLDRRETGESKFLDI